MKKRLWRWTGGAILVALFWLFAWFRSSVGNYFIPSQSMEPTLRVGDRILANRRAFVRYPPRRNDICILTLPNALIQGDNSGGETDFVNRVVGEPGQKIEIQNGVLKVSGKVVAEPFVSWKGGPKYDLKIIGGAVYTREKSGAGANLWTKNFVAAPNQNALNRASSGPIPAEKFLILGDNRGNANDSHIFGLVERERFIGRVSSIYAPDERRRSF